MNTQFRVFVVDDDEAVRESLAMLLEAAGHVVATFPGAGEFLAACTPDIRGCIILDVNMPNMDGPALQEELRQRGVLLPVIFLSGHGTIPTTVRTIKAGAMDFLTKPVDGMVLLAHVQKALAQYSLQKDQAESYLSLASKMATLTDREREVMALTLEGHTSKKIAQRLGISFRTVEIHRAHVMQKTGSHNLLELAHFARMLEPLQAPKQSSPAP